MGEAKRRKSLAPNYGKSSAKGSDFTTQTKGFIQMGILTPPSGRATKFPIWRGS